MCGAQAQDPIDGLDAATVRTLRLAFPRRHVLEHNGGVIDERYQRETGEGSIGRRVRITPAFVDQALDAVVVLAGQASQDLAVGPLLIVLARRPPATLRPMP